jgi:hypothetical protein
MKISELKSLRDQGFYALVEAGSLTAIFHEEDNYMLTWCRVSCARQ